MNEFVNNFRVDQRQLTISELVRFDLGSVKSCQDTELIEGIIARLPLPTVICQKGYKSIGKSKTIIRRISSYCRNLYELNDCSLFPEYNQMKFRILPRKIQRRILETQVNVIVIETNSVDTFGDEFDASHFLTKFYQKF